MAPEDFEILCEYLSENGVKNLKIMGGEPTLHPAYTSLMKSAQTSFQRIIVFTNALTNDIMKTEPRNKDIIVYNFGLLGTKFDSAKLMFERPGTRVLEIMVGFDFKVERAKDILRNIYEVSDRSRLRLSLTLNCVEPIFENKRLIIERWNRLVEFIEYELKVNYQIDHSVPYCFFVDSDMNIKHGVKLCNMDCVGLIDTRLNILHCNQTQEPLCRLRQNGNLLPFKIVENYLYRAHLKMLTGNMDKICVCCPLFNVKCNGGCFMHKNANNREAIFSATNLPLMVKPTSFE